MNIKIKDYVNDDIAISYTDGVHCFETIKENINSEEIILDFEGIEYVITAFLNPIIGDLIIDNGKDIMKKIKIINATDKTLEKIKLVRDGSLLKREDLD